MPVKAKIGKKEFEGNNQRHCEETIFDNPKYSSGELFIELDAWPCCLGERGKNCHALFIRQSLNRTITVTVEADHAGYAVNHGYPAQTKGTITYKNGVVTIDASADPLPIKEKKDIVIPPKGKGPKSRGR
jgi:hypothetical protein